MDHEGWRDRQGTVRIDVDRHEFDLAYAEFGRGDPVTLFFHGIPTWETCSVRSTTASATRSFPTYTGTATRGTSGRAATIGRSA